MAPSVKSIKKNIEKEQWTDGEIFLKQVSPMPSLRARSRRKTSVLPPKKQEEKLKIKPRMSIVLKRLDVQFNPSVGVSPISNRTRRKSIAHLHKMQPVSQKSQIPRVFSVKGNVDKPSKMKEDKPSVVQPRISKVNLSKNEGNTNKQSISDNNLDSRQSPLTKSKSAANSSPTATKKMTRINNKSLSKVNGSVTKLTSSEDKKARKSTAELTKTSKTSPKSSTKPKKVDELVKPLPKNPSLKKPLKRLNLQTPSPRIYSRPLTRSSKRINKRVQMTGQSPTAKEVNLRKTPLAVAEKGQTPIIKKEPLKYLLKPLNISQDKAIPFTPKPEEPLKMLKQTMKSKVDMKIQAATKEKKNLNTKVETTKTPEKNSRIQKHKIKKQSTPYSLSFPTTPKSSRKSSGGSQSFRKHGDTSASSLGKSSLRKSPSTSALPSLEKKFVDQSDSLLSAKLVNNSPVPSIETKSFYRATFPSLEKKYANRLSFPSLEKNLNRSTFLSLENKYESDLKPLEGKPWGKLDLSDSMSVERMTWSSSTPAKRNLVSSEGRMLKPEAKLMDISGVSSAEESSMEEEDSHTIDISNGNNHAGDSSNSLKEDTASGNKRSYCSVM